MKGPMASMAAWLAWQSWKCQHNGSTTQQDPHIKKARGDETLVGREIRPNLSIDEEQGC